MLVQNVDGLFRAGPLGRCNEILGHDLPDLQVQTLLEPDVTMGEDPHEGLVLNDGQPGDVALLHHLQGLGKID